MSENLIICSLNVRGLSNVWKRRETFRWLKLKKFSIYYLQEVHSIKENEAYWSSEWGYSAIFSSFTSASAGVCILFNNNFEFKVIRQFSDPAGRFIIVDIETEGRVLTLVNIYAPNQDKPDFFRKVADQLLSFDCEEICLGGDFNLVLDISMDKKGGNPVTHSKSLEEVKRILAELDLTDIWRDLNPDAHRFTWRRRNPDIQCCLDFFLISSGLSTICVRSDILPGYKTDHSLVTLEIDNKTNPRGPGFWKLNTSFLLETEYVNMIKETISEVASEYSSNDDVDAVLLWDTIKMKIRGKSIEYAKRKRRKIQSEEQLLESEISDLQKKLEETVISDYERVDVQNKLEVKTQQREQICQYKTRGSIIRSRTRWYNEGEKNTKYFLSLEKRHHSNKTIKTLQLADGKLINTDREILKEAKSFYENLYSSCDTFLPSDHDDLFFVEANDSKLTEHEQKECEGPLTEAECFTSLKTMKANKSPGSDGLPAEFYNAFWKDIWQYLLNALNTSFIKGRLSITQRRGFISLIPKKNKDAKLLKNWRPITLLNCDYKIASKSIANRLKKFLPALINNDQTGFQKNRFIGENIRLIDSVINYTREKKIPGLLLFVDFEKAFDSLEWSFCDKSLKYFNFGPSLIAWIKLFYTDITSSVQNNGWSSDFFNLNRGVRQGCPLSPYLFLLCVEVLGNKVRNDNQIKGIKVMNTECKLSQYADDTTMILDGSKPSFTRAISVLDEFALVSGLKVNYEKTECLWIGTRLFSPDVYFSGKPIKWAVEKVFALGVWFSVINQSMQVNFIERLENMKKILNSWTARRLTLLGKITIIKSLAVSTGKISDFPFWVQNGK